MMPVDREPATDVPGESVVQQHLSLRGGPRDGEVLPLPPCDSAPGTADKIDIPGYEPTGHTITATPGTEVITFKPTQ